MSFDEGHEVRGVFLDILKTFGKVWHEVFLFKLKEIGISGNFSSILIDFLNNRKKRVVLYGQNSPWIHVEAKVPQGSILDPLLFLMYINDLLDNLTSKPELFADNTSHFSVLKDIDSITINLNGDFAKISGWVFQWKVHFSSDPKKQVQEIIFSQKLQK